MQCWIDIFYQFSNNKWDVPPTSPLLTNSWITLIASPLHKLPVNDHQLSMSQVSETRCQWTPSYNATVGGTVTWQKRTSYKPCVGHTSCSVSTTNDKHINKHIQIHTHTHTHTHTYINTYISLLYKAILSVCMYQSCAD